MTSSPVAQPVDPSVLRAKLEKRVDLAPEEAQGLVRALIETSISETDAKSLLAALAAKGESVGELEAFARDLRARARPFLREESRMAVDLCGTGGAPTPTFNVSTVSAFVVAAAGVPVAKHGNVSARGSCGSSDLLEALGLPIRTSIAFSEASFRRAQLAFLHAPLYHAATRSVAKIRKELGTRTIFNQLGPLTNPSGVRFQVVGCFSRSYAERVGPVLAGLGTCRSLTVHGLEGTDEFSPQGPSHAFVTEVPPSRAMTVDPSRHLGAPEREGAWGPRAPAESALEAQRILGGGAGSVRGSVLLTSGAALWVGGKTTNLDAGVRLAREVLDSGAAREKMLFLQELSREREWT